MKIARSKESVENRINALDDLLREYNAYGDPESIALILGDIAGLSFLHPHSKEAVKRNKDYVEHLERFQLRESLPRALHHLAKAYYNDGNKELSLDHYKRAGSMLTIRDSLYAINMAQHAEVLNDSGDQENALAKGLEALELMQSLRDQDGEAFVCNVLGRIYQKYGRMGDAALNFKKAYEYYEANQKYKELIIVCINLGALFGNQKLWADAEKYMKQAAHFYNYTEVQSNLGDIYYNLYICHLNTSNRDSAIHYLQRSTAIYKQFNSERNMLRNNTAMTGFLRKEGKYSEAIATLKENYKLAKKSNDNLNLLLITNSMGTVYGLMDSLEQSIKSYSESVEYCRILNEPRYYTANYKGLFYVYVKMANTDSINRYFTLYEQFRDSTISLSHSEAMARIMTEYETEKKSRKIAELSRSNTENELKLSKQEADLKIAHLQRSKQEQELAFMASQNSLLESEREIVEMEMAKVTLENKTYEQDILLTSTNLALQKAQLEKHRNEKIILAIASIGFMAFLIFLSYFLYERRRSREEIILSRMENKLMRSQMKPHFVFNALQSINKYILVNENSKASDFLTRFSIIIRSFLHNSINEEVSLAYELETIRSYLEIEKELLKDKFDYEINVDPQLDLENTILPPLLIQPFLENAIWHGIAPKEGQGHLILEIRKDNDELQMVIEDDGIGRYRSKKTVQRHAGHLESVGLDLTHKRLKSIGKGKIADPLVFRDLVHGLRVKLSIPLKEMF